MKTRWSTAAVMLAAVLALGGTVTTADAATSAEAATDRMEAGLEGKRVPVGVQSLDVFREPARMYLGNLQRGETFTVRKLSASGKYAYGVAFGHANKVGWVSRSGLAVGSPTANSGDSGGPRLVGTPSVRYDVVAKEGLGRYVSIATVLRADRKLDADARHAVTAPDLRQSQSLPDRLFGGLTLRTIGDRGHCYVGEVSQLRQRSRVEGRTWRLGLFDSDEVVSNVRSVTLKRAKRSRWERIAVKRLGC